MMKPRRIVFCDFNGYTQLGRIADRLLSLQSARPPGGFLLATISSDPLVNGFPVDDGGGDDVSEVVALVLDLLHAALVERRLDDRGVDLLLAAGSCLRRVTGSIFGI